MRQICLFSRRSFLIQGLIAVPALVASQNLLFLPKKDDFFTSEYILDFSSFSFEKNLQINDLVSQITSIVIDLKPSAMEWFQHCGTVQAAYMKQGLLLGSQRTLSQENRQLKFITQWRDQKSFISFFKESEFYKLDYAYLAAGFAPKMAKSYKVFPSSPEAYLLLQKKHKQG